MTPSHNYITLLLHFVQVCYYIECIIVWMVYYETNFLLCYKNRIGVITVRIIWSEATHIEKEWLLKERGREIELRSAGNLPINVSAFLMRESCIEYWIRRCFVILKLNRAMKRRSRVRIVYAVIYSAQIKWVMIA